MFAGRDTRGNVFNHLGLAHLILAAVAMGRIDDQTMFARTGRLGALQIDQRLRHGCGIAVRSM